MLIAIVILLIGLCVGIYRRTRVRTWHYDAAAPELPAALKDPLILVFSKTNGYRHAKAIPAANAAIASLAEKNGWSVFFTENGAVFNPANLLRFRATIWNNTSGDLLNEQQKQAFRSYIENGGGFVGIHGAGGDFSYDWRWYVETLIGAQFIGHTLMPRFPTATIHVENHDHPATKTLPHEWVRSDEWYSFKESPRAQGATVLATLDETTYRPRMVTKNLRMGSDHPIIWKHCVGKGRVFYSALGHTASAYREPNYVAVLQAAIAWAARLEGSGCLQ
ncbi:MAG TPA: ThuA domain-containing protein [Candidatus Acidoferrales bacterium]|nr:ThuA domain-containing protein [Candidatus Acidoferrales bacterium]